MEASVRPEGERRTEKSVKFDGPLLQEDEAEMTKEPSYSYEPEEKGETWDIYKERSIMENVAKRKSEDAVLMKAKADAAARHATVAAAAVTATSGFGSNCEVSEGRKTRGRTAVVATSTIEVLSTEPGVPSGDEEESEEEEAEADDDSDKDFGTETQAEIDAQAEAAAAKLGLPTDGSDAQDDAPGRASVMQATTHPLEVLQNGCPPGVPPACKEDYLCDADFESAFRMKREAFSKLPKWKQQNLKKLAKIF